MRTRDEIEQDIIRTRRDRDLYVSAQGVSKCHAELDRLLEEWEAADALVHHPTGRDTGQVPHR